MPTGGTTELDATPVGDFIAPDADVKTGGTSERSLRLMLPVDFESSGLAAGDALGVNFGYFSSFCLKFGITTSLADSLKTDHNLARQ